MMATSRESKLSLCSECFLERQLHLFIQTVYDGSMSRTGKGCVTDPTPTSAWGGGHSVA
jgi:hypothetical protein